MKQIDKIEEIRKADYGEVVLYRGIDDLGLRQREYNVGVVVPRNFPRGFFDPIISAMEERIRGVVKNKNFGFTENLRWKGSHVYQFKDEADFDFNGRVLVPRKPKDKTLVVCNLPIITDSWIAGVEESALNFTRQLEEKMRV